MWLLVDSVGMLWQTRKTRVTRQARSRAVKYFILLTLMLICSFAEANSQLMETCGVTLAGSSGLITVPTPDFATSSRGIALKMSSSDGTAMYNNTRIKLSKDETLISIRAKTEPEVEVSLVHLRYDRQSIAELTGSAKHFGLGVKYSPLIDKQDMCVGFNFTPMTTSESMLADIEQIESLRNVYVTVGEALTPKITGFLNVAAAFAGKQKIDFSDGTRRDIKRNDIYTATMAFSYRMKSNTEFISEFKVGHYRNLLTGDAVRYRMHAGVRFGRGRYNFELNVLDLSDSDPTLALGGSVKF